MTCPFCKHENDKSADVCVYCRAALPVKKEKEKKEVKKDGE